MRKKLTLTIDEDVYNELQRLPRWVSVSEIASVFLRTVVLESKRGYMGEEDLVWVINEFHNPKIFEEVLSERWGPTIYTIYEKLALPSAPPVPPVPPEVSVTKSKTSGRKKKK